MNFVVSFIYTLLIILQWAILIRVLLSWLPMAGINLDPDNILVRLLFEITEPILAPIRKFAMMGMMDLSPIVAFFIIMILLRVIAFL